LGVGPENYYFLANKYYNPELVKYDPSWFDKPHNYILEVLVTGGILSFVPYLAMLFLVCGALYRGFRSGFFSLLQTSLLLAGFLAYVTQNLFVFDTIPASLMFYLFVGFACYLWSQTVELAADKGKLPVKPVGTSIWAAVAALASGLLALYLVYLTNLLPLQAAKDVNYGYAYLAINPQMTNEQIAANQQKSRDYFESAVNNQFNFDRQDTAMRFSELASTLTQSSRLDPTTTRQIVNEITDNQKKTAEVIDNDPVSWQRLSNDYYLQALVNGTQLGPYPEYAIKKAVALAPNRFEPALFLAQIYVAENKTSQALDQLQSMNQAIPLTAYTASSRWLEATLLHTLGRDKDALQLAESLLQQNFNPAGFRDLSWIINYYINQKDFQTALGWSQMATQIFPNDADAYLVLAELDAKTGQVDLAKAQAQKLIDTNAPNKQAATDFLKSLSTTTPSKK